MLLPPHPDPAIDPFRGGVAVLERDGSVAGHVAAQVTTFWAPFAFTRRMQWQVWYIVVWADGQREPSAEDYPPWTVVAEMQSGAFTWDEEDEHRGQYGVEWLPVNERNAALADLGITLEDF